MALEDLLTSLTTALDANTRAIAAQTAFMQGMTKNASSVGVGSTSAKTAETTSSTSKEEPKPPVKTQAEQLVEMAGLYMKTGDKAQIAANTVNAKKVLAHVGATKFSAMPEDKVEEALQMMTALSEGRTPEQFAEAEAPSEDLV